MIKSSWKDKIQIFLSCIVLTIIWEYFAIKMNNDIYLPTIGQVLQNLRLIINDNNFLYNVGYTMIRALISFLLSLGLAVVVGVTSYLSNVFKNFITPINSLIQSTPTMIVIVLALIWFDKDKSAYIIGFSVVFPILYNAVLGSLNSIDKNINEMMDIYSVRIIEKIRYVYMPSIKIKLVPILISTFSLGIKVVIAGEIYGQPKYGIGSIIQLEKTNFNTPAIFAWIIIIGLISIILNYIQSYISNKNYKWRKI